MLRRKTVVALGVIAAGGCMQEATSSINEEQSALEVARSSVRCGSATITSTTAPKKSGRACTYIEGDLVVKGEAVTDLAALDAITTVTGRISISATQIASLDGLDNLTSVGSSLELWSNPSLTSLDGLSSQLVINGELYLEDNNRLQSLAGLTEGVAFASLQVIANDGITSLQGYPAGLNSLTSVRIEGNKSLLYPMGLEPLESVSGDLTLSGNEALVSLYGLGSLRSVGGAMRISNNDSLKVLGNLASLTSIHGSLGISFNEVLTSCAMSALASVDEDIVIVENPSLPTELAQDLVQQVTGETFALVLNNKK